ncbi:Elongation factor Ts [Apilactobacillus kunkeei]|uniref:Elongation factor Ts n=1 Tax=Apilactobacillus kunkeei DSM 12361 = ATCC 700308 TaxID=1423768 RepID=A0A0R1FRV9_9LACO|nr:translation elongation factor Ts [Apilactobacillus kunkeei]KOY73124.1 Elongation factor Ts [Apilactobacillus kunkeei DSM 12361 = ATCC 700308]KPN82478.1 Elongation factor Ts [Apilactobacillus kunkeei]KRK24620.1 elongation factor Ts [Apilactobacillus kunkeei DSM 12361 = ATCC 700308]MCK8619614.1 translation elongation factor Ts [Apilactobacillus kunkeei]MCK8625998.1 translation elongation factor Ts [Apilactobacillus kunkeei]
MAKITAAQVKELREKTSVGMMDAKKALVASDGDEKKALEYLREKGIAKAEKKSDRVAAAGLTRVVTHGNDAAIVEVNAETDFVSGNDDFKNLIDLIAAKIVEAKPADVEAALALDVDGETINDKIINTTQITGEKITLRRFVVLTKNDDESFGHYLHNQGLIGALVQIQGVDETVAKHVAMHIAATKPEYLDRNDVPQDRLEAEREELKKEALQEGKPENIVEKMVEGRLNKFLSEISLADQEFVMDSDKTVAEYVKENGGQLKAFVRYEVGEGIEKEETNFADEVNSQIK